MATVYIPAMLRPLAGGAATVPVEGNTLREVLAGLQQLHPAVVERVLDANGVRPEVFIAIGAAESFSLDDAVKATDEIHILPAIAGG